MDLKYVDYYSGMSFLFHRVMDLGRIVLNFEKETSRVMLKINTTKTKVNSLSGHSTLPTCDNERDIEGVDQFVYIECVFLPAVA